MQRVPSIALAFIACLLGMSQLKAETINPPTGSNICLLSSLDLSKVTYFNDDGKNNVYANKATFGSALIVAGNTYTSGVGTHAPSKFVVKVNGATTFHAVFGIDAAAPTQAEHGIVDYNVITYGSDR